MTTSFARTSEYTARFGRHRKAWIMNTFLTSIFAFLSLTRKQDFKAKIFSVHKCHSILISSIFSSFPRPLTDRPPPLMSKSPLTCRIASLTSTPGATTLITSPSSKSSKKHYITGQVRQNEPIKYPF